MPFFEDVFTEVAVVLALAAAVGAIALWLRQPLIAAFILVGILVGPVCFDFMACWLAPMPSAATPPC